MRKRGELTYCNNLALPEIW
uniref:Uncharacterized protein n=1 Tax=Arundo donax TaxID=35708 RepID=A0A0A9G1S7_ARUDO